MNKEIILYTIGCPLCDVLKSRLDKNNITYETVDDVEKLEDLKIDVFPILEVDGERYDFDEAMAWVSRNIK